MLGILFLNKDRLYEVILTDFYNIKYFSIVFAIYLKSSSFFMDLKKRIVLGVMIGVMFPVFGQVRLSKFLQPSQISRSENNSLYFIDFWATWCVPCGHASKYLENLQSQFPNQFYVLSLSQENGDLVNRFIQKHPTKLAVAIDYEGEFFKENDVRSLPYGILLNATGEKLWEGHPANFKPYLLKQFLKRESDSIHVNDFFYLDSYEGFNVNDEISPISDFEYSEIENREFRIITSKDYIEIEGSLQDILSYTLQVYKAQIEVPGALNRNYKVSFKMNTKSYKHKTKTICKALGISLLETSKNGEVCVLDIQEPKFWGTEQINWGSNNQQYLIGDSEFLADNVSVYDMAYTLSQLLEKPVLFKNQNVDDSLHDWQIHYKYFELMYSNLLDDYGIEIKTKKADYPEFIISKKAP